MLNRFKRAIARFRLWLWTETNWIYEPYLNKGFNACQSNDLETAKTCVVKLETIFGINDTEVNKLRMFIRKQEARNKHG